VLTEQQWGAGIVFAIFAVFAIVCFISWIPRIPFAVLMLQTCMDVAKRHGHVFLVSAIGGLVALAFSAWFSITLVAIYVAYEPGNGANQNPACVNNDCSTAKVIGLLVFITFAGYWISEWLKSTIHTTVAGVYGSWYFSLTYIFGNNISVREIFSRNVVYCETRSLTSALFSEFTPSRKHERPLRNLSSAFAA
jgi:hypothetical protein